MPLKRTKPPTSKAKADGVPLPTTIHVLPAHHNAKASQEKLDAVAEYALTGQDNTGLDQTVRDAAMDKFKRIESPAGCPIDHEEWRQEVSRLLGIAVWKMANKLAREGDAMHLSQLPVAMAIALEKRLLLAGAPTTYNLSVHATINHESLLKRIQETPPTPIEGKVQ